MHSISKQIEFKQLNLTKPTCKVRFAFIYKLLKELISNRCKISNTTYAKLIM